MRPASGATLPHCVVYTSACHPRWQARAAQGGPMGELVMLRSLVEGLRRIGARVSSIGSLRRFAAHRARHAWDRVARGRRPLYFLDPVTLELASRYRLLGAGDAPRVLLLDWFGTPPSLVSAALPALTAARYLVPYPDEGGWNTFLGFALGDRIAPVADRPARRGLIWGKEPRYVRGAAAAAIARLASVCELHATIADADQGSTDHLPTSVVNHGVLDQAAWRSLLRESSFVVGLGDPIAGPTALEALAEGCAYLNPCFSPPRLVNGVAELAIASQHPYAARIGAPFVFDVSLSDPESFVRAAEASFDAEPRRARIEQLRRGLAPFRREAYESRLRALVETAVRAT
jgi:hypothetical protein